MRTLHFIFTSILLLSISLNAVSQNKGTIEGEALDALNLSPLRNWTIEAVQGSSAIAVIVNSSGEFVFENLTTGLYNVRAISPSGQMQTLHEVLVRSSKEVTVSTNKLT